jgi:hypothetical protein
MAFKPFWLGHGTTVDVGADILAPAGHVPSPLIGLDMRYPNALGVAAGGLGLTSCSQTRLETLGPSACPASSRMGEGSALAEIQIGPEIIQETAHAAIVRGPQQGGRLALLFYVSGISPVLAHITFPGLLLPGPGPGEESIHIGIPLVPSLPGAPDVAVVRLHASLGPRGLIYYEHIRGKLIPYRPKGVLLPNKCPRGGFHFAATFTFLDGSQSQANTSIPCRSTRRTDNGR